MGRDWNKIYNSVNQPQQPTNSNRNWDSIYQSAGVQTQPKSQPQFTGNQEFAQNHPTFTKVMQTLTNPINNFLDKTTPGQFISRASESAGDMVTMGANSKLRQQANPNYKPTDTGSQGLNKTADIAGSLLGLAGGMGTGATNPNIANNFINSSYATGGKVAEKGFNALTKNLNPATKGGKVLLDLAKRGATGAGAGATYGAMEQLGQNNSVGDKVKGVAENAALFGLGDVALSGLGKAFEKYFQGKSTKAELINEASQHGVDENKVQLLLNEPQKALNEPQTYMKPKYSNPTNQTSNEVLGLNSPQTKPIIPTRTESNYYKQKFGELVDLANKTPMPAGREYEYLNDLWSRIAGPKDPSLDKLIELASKETKVPTNPIQKARQNQQNSVYGVNNLINRLKVEQKPINYTNEGTPLQFKRERYNPMQQETLNYTGQLGPLNKVKVNVDKPKIDENLLNSLQFGDRIKVRQDRGEVNLEFVKREGNQVVVRRSNGKETIIPAELVKSKTMNKSVNLSPLDNILSNKEVASGLEQITKKAESNNSYSPIHLKDISGFKIGTQDLYRNFRQVFGKHIDKVKPILDNFDNAKKDFVTMQEKYLNELKTEIVDKLGIEKGSKESKLVQKYGEGGTEYFDSNTGQMVNKPYTLEDLKRDAPNKWQDIVKADEWFRSKYDELINQVNDTVSRIYPNNHEKIVPKRDNYYRHFRELNGLEGIKNLFDTPAGIDPSLVGTSEFTKPNSRWASFKQKRGMGEYKQDAVGGFLNYVPAASYATEIDPQIKVFNELKSNLAEATTDSKNINNFLNFLDKFSQDLAGKTNPWDRRTQEMLGRKTFKAIDWMNKRVKSNVILGNIGSALSQLANIPQGVAFAKQYSIKGVGKTLLSILDKNPAIKESSFLKERFSGDLFRQFDTRLIEQPKKLASWMLETADRIGSTFIWNSAYEKAIAEKISNPISYADNMTRDLVAGRGIGEVPLLQKSKVFQVFAPFQLEVANLWKIQKDFVNRKDFSALVTLYLANTIFNKAMEQVRGSGVVFDPIQAIYDASTENDLTPLERGGRVAGEILSNLPLGQTIASQYPEYGPTFMGQKLPTRKKLFGRNDPTRYGSGLAGVLTEGLKDPGLKVVLPFGGLQVEKTAKGIKGAYNKGVYSNNNLLSFDTSKLKYPISTDTTNLLKGLLFGTGGFKETKPYYDNQSRPLSEKQTQQYKNSSNKDAFYNNLMLNRRINTLQTRIKDVQKDKNLTREQKKKKIDSLIEQLRALKK